MTLVRSFQLSDYAEVRELLQDVLSDECYEETIEAFGKQLSWDCDLVLVAIASQQVVGVIIGTIDNNNGYYYRIAVSENYQRKGIGKQLTQVLKKRFEQRKVSKVLVTLDSHNELVRPFYESLGYEQHDFHRSFRQLSIVSG